jgi:hypothetical protein
MGNFVSGNVGAQIGKLGYFAQPFYANKTAQVDGVFIGPLPPGPELSVSIDPDAGVNKPSLAPIASGILDAGNITLDYGPEFVQFSSVANLQAGQKYWIVIHSLGGSYSLSPLVYLPNAPTVPANTPALISQDDGLKWNRVSNSTSMLTYELVSTTSQLPQLNTSALYRYLSSHHSPSVAEGVIHGWTGYMAASELSLFGQITQWFDNQTGRSFSFYAHGQPNVLDQLPAQNQVIFPTSASSDSCPGLARELISKMPVTDVQYYDVGDSGLLTKCSGTNLGPLLQQLESMVRAAGDYGTSSQVSVLVVGDNASSNLTGYLLVSYNVTYSQLEIDPSFEAQGNLSGYNAIVWISDQNPFSSTLEQKLIRYVGTGGTFILTRYGGHLSDLISLSQSLPIANSSLSLPGESYLRLIIANTIYTNMSVSASSANLYGISSDVFVSIHAYGTGKFYIVWFPTQQTNQLSEQVVLLSNIIATSVAMPDPFWYGLNSTLPTPSIEYSVRGGKNGPLLVWLANIGTLNVTFSLHLNGTYYGVQPSWKMLNLDNVSVSAGTGTDLVVEGTLDAGGWLPVYIVPAPSATLIDYSNIEVSRQLDYPHQSLYSLVGLNGQKVFLLVESNTTVSQFLINDRLVIPQLQSTDELSRATIGWVYLNESNTLMVRYTANGSGVLRLLTYTPVATASHLPAVVLIDISAIIVVADSAAFTVISLKRRRKKRAYSEGGQQGNARHA